MKGNLLVSRSSAGSGKTYALVKHYLTLALMTKNPGYYSHILAITFTNPAAAEMKERVILRLKEFASPQALQHGDARLFGEIRSKLNIDPMELHDRAHKALEHMLHNYSKLSIVTIDSFTHRIIRAFARDLRINPDFSIETDESAHYQEVVDSCLEQLGNDTTLTAYIEQFVLEQLDDEKSTNVRQGLFDFTKGVFKENAREPLLRLSQLTLDDFKTIRERVRKEIAVMQAELKKAAIAFVSICQRESIPIEEFSHGKNGPAGAIYKLSLQPEYETPGKRLSECTQNNWVAAKKPFTAAIQALTPELNEKAQAVLDLLNSENIVRYKILSLISKSIHNLGLIQMMAEYSRQLKEENNILLFSDFQEIIATVVQESPAPFIYERAGDRYHHILFDEFQDTSVLQWHNFIPLIENSLSNNHFNLIVGDGKQAIYRWRNGDVEQFIHLPKVPLSKINPRRGDLFEEAYAEDHLTTNYRSSRSIIDFNNALYSSLQSELGTLATVYDQSAQQHKRDDEGYVEVIHLKKDEPDSSSENKDNENIALPILEEIHRCINDALAVGFKTGDIAILTRQKEKQAGVVASYLNEKKLPVVTQESFLLGHSPNVQLLFAAVGYYLNPNEPFHRLQLQKMIFSVFPQTALVDQPFIAQEGKRMVQIPIEQVIEQHFPALLQLKEKAHSVYSFFEQLISIFKLNVDIYLETLLQQCLDLSLKKEWSLREVFLWWKEKKASIYIKGSPDDTAIQVMTIHKSKGLQFPVVIYPSFFEKEKADMIWADIDESEYNIPYVIARPTKENNFLPALEAEKLKMKLDDINVRYVATTRAEQRMYIIIDETRGSRIGAGESNKRLLSHLQTLFSFENGFIRLGNHSSYLPIRREERQSATLLTPAIAPLEKAIRLRLKKIELREEHDPRTIGEYIHEALSLYTPSESVESILKRMRLKYPTMNDEQTKTIQHEVQSITTEPVFESLFSFSGELLNEREIIDQAGQVQRPDRVHLQKESIVVFDFKTGEPDKKHLLQVKQYMFLLSDIFNKPTKGYLAYTKKNELIEVV